MNSSIKPKRPTRHLWWIIPLTAILMVPTLLAASVVSCLRLSGEAKALRTELMQSSELLWDKRIEVSVGGLLSALVRFGVSFVPLEPQVRAAISTVRSASVGVYELRNSPDRIEASALLDSADQIMSDREWDRLATVIDRRELVAVYTLADASASSDIEVCVVVVNQDEMVIVSGRADPEPLFELAMRTARHDSRFSRSLGFSTFNREAGPLAW